MKGEVMRDRLFIMLGIVLFFVCCGAGLYFLENYDAIYYTKIDNTKVEKLATSDAMKYEYKLDCYNKNGSKKEIKFKTSRKLREEAYLSLEVKVFGVHKWQEVQEEDLPPKVKEKLNK